MFVEAKNITFSYGSECILNDISFGAKLGETVAIVGASGSGKSTLLRIISGLLPNNKNDSLKGHLTIDNKAPLEYIKTEKIAFMFQEPALFPNLTVAENISLPLKIKNKSKNDKIYNLIKIVGLNGYENYLPKDLSGGMKTRVSLARSFVTNPELLLLDEPFSSLDVAWQDALYNELNELRNVNNTTVILVTHNINEAIKLSDKVMCISHDGKILINEINRNNSDFSKSIEKIIIDDHNLRKRRE